MFGFSKKKEEEEKEKEEKAEELRRLFVSDVEKICSGASVWELSMLKKHFSELKDCLSNFKTDLENRFSNMNDRFLKLEEQSQQAQRQERRRQAAIESFFDNQRKILGVLEKPQMSPPLEALMALAENFSLTYPEESGTPETDVLRGKLSDLMGCFDLSLVEEAGVDFDPEKHAACGVDFNPAYPENTVLKVVTPGFLLKGKLLRSALVVVNRRTAETKEEETEKTGGLEEPPEYRTVSEEEYYA